MNLIGFKLDQLSYFLEAARHEHIGKASKILSVSPSAISHTIASLEADLGRPLFARQGRRIVLTNHGKLLAEKAEYLLSEAKRVRDELISDQVELRGHYRFAATHLLAENFLLPAWMEVRDNHPKLTAEIYSLRSAEVVRHVAAGEIDFGLCISPHSVPGVVSKTIASGELRVVVRPGHPLLKKSPADQIRLLSQYPASVARGFQGIESCEDHPFFRENSIRPRVELFYDSYSVAVASCGSSDMWTLMPDFIANRFKDRLTQILPKKPVGEVRVSVVSPKSRVITQTISMVTEAAARRLMQV